MSRGIYVRTEAIKKKNSKANKGQIPWNKNIKTGPLSEEHKRSIKKFSEEEEIEIVKQYEQEEVSFETLSEQYNCSHITIRNVIIRQNGLIRSKKEGVNTESCKTLLKLNNSAVKGELISNKNGMFNRRGKNSPVWKGGKYITEEGYVLVRRTTHPYSNAGGYVLEHRLIMEKYLDRYLTKEEIVHHKNSIKDDNRVENLQLFRNNSEHSLFLIQNHSGPWKDTKPELKMKEILNGLNIPFKHQFRIKGINHNFDFKIRNTNILIEVDGDYWHGNPKKFSKLNERQKENKQRDKKINKLAKENDFVLLRFWENDILNSLEKIKIELKNLIGGENYVCCKLYVE